MMNEEDDEDDDLDEGLKVLHVTACKEKKAQLEMERDRREECIERLQVKLKAINSELAARNEEVMTLRRQNDALVQKSERESRLVPAHEADGEESPSGARDNKIRRFMEEQLKEKAQKRSVRNDFGIRLFDEMELMVQKPAEEQRRETSFIDTVLITWSRGPGADQTYNLTYRVDRNMTSKKLREDACFYWGISEVEYILKTVMTNSKVQDDVPLQTCFRPSEEAHLMLVHKTPNMLQASPEELEAIRPRTGVKSRSKPKRSKDTKDNKPAAADRGADFSKQLDVVPGFKEFMLQRDRNVREHLEGLKLSSLCLFTCLAISGFFTIFSIRPTNTEFMCHWGVQSALTDKRTDMTTGVIVPAFADISSHAEIWEWLGWTVPQELLNPASRLRRDNYLPGWAELRVQRVAPAAAGPCGEGGLPRPGALCAAEAYGPGSAETADIAAVRAIWASRAGADGRSASVLPWRHRGVEQAERDAGAAEARGPFSAFDASGYAVAYSLQPANLTATRLAFEADMAALRRAGWLGPNARSLQLTFAAYNGNRDYWMAASFLLELSANGVVHPRGQVLTYRPKFTDHQWIVLFVNDCSRLGLLLYLGTWHLYWELRFESKRQRAEGRGLCRRVRFRNLVDVALLGLFIHIYVVRYFVLGAMRKTTAEIARELGTNGKGVMLEANLFRAHLVAEAVVMALTMVRFLYCCRVNRQVFIIWESLRTSMVSYGSFLLIFCPVFVCFAVLMQTLWGMELAACKTFWDALTSAVMLLCGHSGVIRVEAVTKPWTVLYSVAFYFVIILLFVNSWIAVLVFSYQKTRVAAGYNPKAYAWGEEEWIRWCLWSWLGRVWRWLRPRKRSPDEVVV